MTPCILRTVNQSRGSYLLNMKFKKFAVIVMSALTMFGAVDTISVATTTQEAQAATKKKSKTYKSNLSPKEQAAKNWIAYHESRGSYTVRNGQYIGRYQLSSAYLHGDYSKANQEKTADRYVKARYGNWVNAKKHWVRCNWY